MRKKRSCVRVRFSTILWGVMAIVLCAAPFVRAEDIDGPVTGPYYVSGTVNILPGADITWGLYIMPGSTVNIYGGNVDEFGITLLLDGTDPVVTVHGTGFSVDGVPLDPSATEFTVAPDGGGTLTGTYENGDPIELLFHSDIPINLVNTAGGGPEEIEVEIDIKPGSDPNPINPGSNGLIPVAILTTDDFDAADVEPNTVTLAGVEVAVRGKAGKLMARLEDVDGDGDDDLLLQVETQSEGTLWESGPVTLTGKTYDGDNIEGTDEVIIVPPDK